jgi:ribosome recycling factor
MADEITLDDVLLDAEDHMDKSIKATAHEFSLVRTGRATPALVEHIKVDYHGTLTPLQQLALIRAPEPRLLVIEPWEKNIIRNIEKGLADGNIGLNPQNDGKVIRIAIPPLTEERRKDMVKSCAHGAEQGKVALRNVRRDAIDRLRKLQKSGAISEDELHRAEDEVQKLTDQYIKKVDELLAAKRNELLED